MKNISKPSQVLAKLIDTIYKYNPAYKHPTVEMVIGTPKAAHILAGGRIFTSDTVLVTSELMDYPLKCFTSSAEYDRIEDDELNSLMNAVENLSAGYAYSIFKLFGLEKHYVKPDRWWCIVPGNWQEHIGYMGDYLRKLQTNGL